eukprot:jgi/Botrbrau1/19217/Bobra.0077s0117.1
MCVLQLHCTGVRCSQRSDPHKMLFRQEVLNLQVQAARLTYLESMTVKGQSLGASNRKFPLKDTSYLSKLHQYIGGMTPLLRHKMRKQGVHNLENPCNLNATKGVRPGTDHCHELD